MGLIGTCIICNAACFEVSHAHRITRFFKTNFELSNRLRAKFVLEYIFWKFLYINVVCKMAAILPWPQYVNQRLSTESSVLLRNKSCYFNGLV